MDYAQLSLEIQEAKNFLIDTATGTPINIIREHNYSLLRQKILRKLYHENQFKKIIPDVLIKYQTLNSFWNFIKQEQPTYAKRRAFLEEQFSTLMSTIEKMELTENEELLQITSDITISEESRRIAELINSGNFDSAITASRTLIQRTEEKIIKELTGKEADRNKDADDLHKEAMILLSLDASKDYDKRLKQIITGLNQVNSGIAQVRNVASNAHSPKHKAEKRHALLAYNAAVTLCQFLLESMKSKQ